MPTLAIITGTTGWYLAEALPWPYRGQSFSRAPRLKAHGR